MKHIENRKAEYVNRKLIVVEEVLERNNAGDITKFYGFIGRADGDVDQEGTPINKDTLKFIRKGYRVPRSLMELRKNLLTTNTLTIECLEEVNATVENSSSFPFNLSCSVNNTTGIVTVTATVKNNVTGTGVTNFDFYVTLTSKETNVKIGYVKCTVEFDYD